MNFSLSLLLLIFSFFSKVNYDTIAIKCMVQMIEYRGEGAYFAISIINPQGNYIKTLYVMGNDKTWFSDMKGFWEYLKVNDLYTDKIFYPMIDGISGATISGGERSIFQIQIPTDLINKGNRLRFETAVEDKGYYKDDVTIDLSTEAFLDSYNGNGYIQKVKFLLSD